MDQIGPSIGTHASQFLLADQDRVALAQREEKYAQFLKDQERLKAIRKTTGTVGHEDVEAIDVKSKVLDWVLVSSRYAILAQASHVAKVVDLTTGNAVRWFRGHGGPVTSVVVWLTRGNGQWETAFDLTGKSTKENRESESDVEEAQRKMQGEIMWPAMVLATGSWDKTIRLWDGTNGQVWKTLTGHGDYIKSLVWAPGGKLCYGRKDTKNVGNWGAPRLFSGSVDATIRQWDVVTGQCVRTLRGHTRGVDGLVYNGETDELFSASSDTTLKQWDLATGSVLREFKGHHTSVVALTLYPDYLSQHDPQNATLSNIADENDEVELWSGSVDKFALQWDVSRGSVEIKLEHPNVASSLLVTDAFAVTGCRDEHVRVWDKATGELVKTLVGHFDEVTGIAMIGQTLYTASLDGTVRRWPLGKILRDKTPVFDVLQCVREAKTKGDSSQPDVTRTASLNGKTLANSENALTEEEERELAELMSDLDDE
ncbi:hypothetical protein IWQ61_005582 [Dispira simplex]|nr:hypothetical protein IWQ61_005582 [Dispira simplex]